MRLNNSDLVLHVLHLLMHSMAQEKPVLKITSPKEYSNRFFYYYYNIFISVCFFHYKIIHYQANNFNTSNRRIALWIGMEALCALI